jgi:hypothetical protein
MRLTTVAFALFASLAMAAPSPAGEVGPAGAEIVARGSCPAGCGCDGGICRCASVCTIPLSPAVFGNGLSLAFPGAPEPPQTKDICPSGW